MRLLNILAISLGIVLLMALPACAAGDPFSVSGQVIDRYGYPVSGANVTLIDNSYKVLAEKYTNENGNYDFVNVVADEDTVTVRVNYTAKDGRTYTIPSYYTLWYPSKNIQFIPPKQTQFRDYPRPTYGYLYGAIQTGPGNGGTFIDGIVYLVDVNNGVKYYEFADRTDGKGSFYFYVPPGNYMLYAQHYENGNVYESAHMAVTVAPSNDPTEILPTAIVLPLNTPTSSPDPAVKPVHHENRVSGSVKMDDGSPVVGATVTLFENADNDTGYVGLGAVTSTDAYGHYEFTGVCPTTDDNRTIQSGKEITVAIGLTENSSWGSEAKMLFYPDVIMGYGKEDAARNVTIPTVVLPLQKTQAVNFTSTPEGAFIYIDGMQLYGPDGKALVTPCEVYVDVGTHAVKMTKDGYVNRSGILKVPGPAGLSMALSKPVPATNPVLLALALVLGVLAFAGVFLLLKKLG